MSILSERAMLSVLNISQWTARKTDKHVTRETLDRYHASHDAGRWNKQLVSKHALAEITTIHGQARAYHRVHTLPWLDDGPRILPARFHAEYADTMAHYEEQALAAHSRFIDGYPEYVEMARTIQANMFNGGDYPSTDRIADKFGFRVTLMPLPDAQDFRVDISEGAAERIRESVRATNDAVIKSAVQDVFARAHDVLSSMVESLKSYKPATDEHKATGIFRDSLVSNVADLVTMIPGLNISDDANLAWLAQTMGTHLTVSPEALRTDDALRASVASEAQTIMDHVSSFMD